MSLVAKVWGGSEWVTTGGYPGIKARGGQVHEYEIGGVLYRSHAFLDSVNTTDFIVDAIGSFGSTIDYLLVAGGGCGGSGYNGGAGGGGGAGGFLTGSLHVSVGTYPIVVGRGGRMVSGARWYQENGANTTAFGLTAIGGGRGGPGSDKGSSGSSGGSGGGASTSGGSGGAGTAGQGNNGGSPRGGGGGAGSAGIANGAGGAGLPSNLRFGTDVYYAGGGAGVGAGGIGGGTNSSYGWSGAALPCEPNTGGGGGAHGHQAYGTPNSGSAGDGGSGIVVVRYRIQ